MPQDTKSAAQEGAQNSVRVSSRELIEIVRLMLAAPDSSQNEIIPRIEQLEVATRDHFGHASEQGIFEETVFHAPWLTPLSECLRQQHLELESVLEQLVAQARSGDGGTAWRSQMLNAVDGLAELHLELDAGIENLTQSRGGWLEEGF